jgi:hypothetical protein
MQVLDDFHASDVLHILGWLLGWLWGGARTAGAYALQVLAQLPVLAVGGAQLGLGLAMVAVFVGFTRFASRVLDRARLQRGWHRLLRAAAAYIMRKRRWLRLWKAFVRNRKRIKYTLLLLHLVDLIRVTYVWLEDMFFTCYWYFLVMQDAAGVLVDDFYIYYEEYYIEMENVMFVYWYYFYIFREQALYFQLVRRVMGGRPVEGRRAWHLQWEAYLRARRLSYMAYYYWSAFYAHFHRGKGRRRR